MATSPQPTPQDLDHLLAALATELSTLDAPGSAGVPPASEDCPADRSTAPPAAPDSIEQTLDLLETLADTRCILRVLQAIEPQLLTLATSPIPAPTPDPAPDPGRPTDRAPDSLAAPTAQLDHLDRVLRLTTRCAALRKTLIQIHERPTPRHLDPDPTPTSEGPGAILSPESRQALAALHPSMGFDTTPPPPNTPSPAPNPDNHGTGVPADPPGKRGTGSAPLNHNPHSTQHPGAVPVPLFPPLGTFPPFPPSPTPASASSSPIPTAAPNVASTASVSSVPAIPTIPLTQLKSTTEKLSERTNAYYQTRYPARNPGTPTTINHGGARNSQNAIDDTVATVTGMSGPKARHTTVTNARPTHQRITNASHSTPHPHSTPPSTKVWIGGDSDAHGGLGEGEENFSKLSSPSPSSPTPPNSSSAPTPANERPPP